MKSPDKVPITIEVEPEITAITMAFIEGFLPSLLEALYAHLPSDAVQICKDNDFGGRMYEVLDEIHEKCMRNVYLDADGRAFIKMMQMAAGVQDDDEIVN